MNSRIERLVKDIFSQAENGRVIIGNPGNQWTYYLRFYTKTPQKSTAINGSYAIINIPNFDMFINKLEQYLQVASVFYEGDQDYLMLNDSPDGYTQKQIIDLLINCSPADCENIYKFIDTRTKMLKANVELGEKSLGEYCGLTIKTNITKNNRLKTGLEGPYCFTTSFIDQDKNKFTLPSVIFGVADNTVHLYAIQNLDEKLISTTDKKENPLHKKLDRYFRKVNKGVDLQSEIAQVTPNALVALTIFAEYAQSKGKNNIETPSYMPIRYHGNKVAGLRRLEGAEKQEWIKKLNHNQYNITNKLQNTLFRYSFHFDNCNCEYSDNTFTTYLTLDSNKVDTQQENIIYDIANAVKKSIQSEREQ